MRVNLFLVCKECSKEKNKKNKPKRRQNYLTSKLKVSKGATNVKIKIKKYCSFCQKSQIHEEEAVK